MTGNQDRLQKEVQERFSNLSDEDLLRMLDGKQGDYTQFAWEVACQEVSKRGGKEAVRGRLDEAHAEVAITEQLPSYTGEGLRCNLYHPDDYAGFWKRTFADWIDGIILSIALALLSVLGEDFAGILGLILFATYHMGFKGARGTTPGYKVLGIRIVSIDGADVTINQIAVRQISSLFSGLPCGLGFFWIAVDPNKQSWHDKIAGTYVVKTSAEPIGAIGIPRTRVVRGALFATLLFLSVAFIGGSYVAITKMTTSSEAYHLSEEYLMTNTWIQRAVGTPRSFHLRAFTVSPTHREYTIYVSGDTEAIIVKTELDRIQDRWTITWAGYTDSDGNHVDITRPPVTSR